MPRGSRDANINVRLRSKKLRQDRRKVERDLKATGKSAGKKLAGGFRSALGGIATLGSVAGLASLGKEALDFERGFTRLGIQAGKGFDASAFRSSIDDISGSMGVGKTQVLGMATAIVNLEGAAGLTTAKLDVLTRASVATGSSMADMAGIGFALRNAFDIKEADELEASLSRIVNIGKQGSVPLNEINAVLQQQATTFSKVSAAGAEGAAQFAALIQVGRKGFGSAAEVGTGIKALIDNLATAAPKLRAFGVNVQKTGKDGRKTFKPIGEILTDIGKSKLMKDETLLARVFGSSEARKLLAVVTKNRAEFDGLVESSRGALDVQEDSAKFLASSAGRFDKALIKIKASFEAAFDPENIDNVVAAAEVLADVIGFATRHVWGLVAAWGAFQALKVARLLAGAAGAASALATNAAGAATGLGSAGAAASKAGFAGKAAGALKFAGALAAAGVAGFALGTALDDLTDGALSGGVFGGLEAVFGEAGAESFFEKIKRLRFEKQQDEAAARRKAEADKASGLTPDELAVRDEESRALSVVARKSASLKRERDAPFQGRSFEERTALLTAEQKAQVQPQIDQAQALLDAIRDGFDSVEIRMDTTRVNGALKNNPSNRRAPAP
jgi:hypothetical protein